MKVAGYDTQMGGNIGTAILSLERDGPRMWSMSSWSDRSDALARSFRFCILLTVTEDHIDRHENAGALRREGATGCRRTAAGLEHCFYVNDIWCRNIADRLDQAGKRVVRISVKNPLPDGIYVERETIVQGFSGAGAVKSQDRRHRLLRELRTTRRTRPAPRPARGWRWAYRQMSCKTALRSFGLAHRMEQVGRQATCCSSTIPRAPHDAAAHALSSFADIFDCRRCQAGRITSLTEYFPRIRKAYLIGEAAQEFAGTLGERAPHETLETLDVAVVNAARDAEASGLADPVGVAVARLAASFRTSTAIFEIRGAKFRDLVMVLPGRQAGGG